MSHKDTKNSALKCGFQTNGYTHKVTEAANFKNLPLLLYIIIGIGFGVTSDTIIFFGLEMRGKLTMAEYIKREKVIDALHQLVAETADDSVHTKAYLAGYKAALEMAELYMIDISAADVCPEKYRIEREIPIWELELSTRSYNCLTRAGCKTVGDILKLSNELEGNLIRVRNLGEKSAEEIAAKLNCIGFDVNLIKKHGNIYLSIIPNKTV